MAVIFISRSGNYKTYEMALKISRLATFHWYRVTEFRGICLSIPEVEDRFLYLTVGLT
jgi:hypothetical protein